MNEPEAYMLLLSDSFFASLAFDSSTELVIHTMKIFESYSNALIIICSMLGFTAAALSNYYFGKIIFRAIAPTNRDRRAEMDHKIGNIQNSKLLPLILAFSAAPFFGKFVILFAGFCHIRLYKTILIASAAKLVYYTYLIFV